MSNTSNRNFKRDVVASLKDQRRMKLAAGLPVDEIETELARYGAPVESAAAETKNEPPAPQTTTAPTPTPAAPEAPPSTAAAPAKKAAPAKAAPAKAAD